MNRILYETNKCRCNEKPPIVKKKKRKSTSRPRKRVFVYPDFELIETESKTFQIKYKKKLSTVAKLILSSFQDKYIYYAIDDILYSFQLNSTERENLLAILYSPILSLQNNFSIDFFDIWVDEIYLHEVSKINRFLKNDSSNLEQFSYITIKFYYRTKIPPKKRESLW